MKKSGKKGSFLRILSGKITEKLTKVSEFFFQKAVRTLRGQKERETFQGFVETS